MILLYRIVTFVIYAIVYPYGRWRAWRGDALWQGRLGLIAPHDRTDIWLHAASVGEIRVISYLVACLYSKRPDVSIHVTAMTRAGYRTALATMNERTTITYFPLDVLPVVSKTLSRINPSLIGFAETEIWPNLVLAACRRYVPIVLINGRMSEKAMGRYRLMRSTMRKLLNCYDRFFFKTEQDAGRYEQFLSVDKKSICTVAGDMKFDAPVRCKTPELVGAIREELGVNLDSFVMVAGSTRPGEETALASIYAHLSQKIENLVMVIAPRHLDRLSEIKTMLAEKNIDCSIFGEPDPQGIILVDRMGLLSDLYLAADLAFVGGTLVDIGGHNLLEPVWNGTPVLFGSSTYNVTEAADYIVSGNFGRQVKSVEDLETAIEAVRTGKLTHNIKTDNVGATTPTTIAADYMLARISDA